MQVFIRDVDPQYIEVIDKKVKEIKERTGTKYSRNDYLIQLLRTDSEIDLINYKKHEYDISVEKMRVAFEKNTTSINELTEVYSNLFNFLITQNSKE